MAAALLNKICGEFFEAHSAGLEPGELNPLAVETLREIGIDISRNKTQAVFDVFKTGQLFPFVITVCSETEAKGTRKILREIDRKIRQFCDEQCVREPQS